MAQASQSQISRAGSFTVGDLLTVQARRRPEATAVVDGARTYTYKSLNSRANRLAHALTSARVTGSPSFPKTAPSTSRPPTPQPSSA